MNGWVDEEVVGDGDVGWGKVDVVEGGVRLGDEGEVGLNKWGVWVSRENVMGGEGGEGEKGGVVDDGVEVLGGLEEVGGGLGVEVVGDDMWGGEGGEIGVDGVRVVCCVGEVEVGGVFEVGRVVEVRVERGG